MSNAKIKVKHWSFIAYANVLGPERLLIKLPVETTICVIGRCKVYGV